MQLWLALIVMLSLTWTSCTNFRPGFIDENSFEVPQDQEIVDGNFDGPRNGHFEGEVWVPDDPKIEWTYRIPDVSAGFIFDAKVLDVTPSIQVELVEFDLPFPWPIGTWKLDTGVAYNRTYGYVGPLLTSIFEISIGGVAGYNWDNGNFFYGVGFTIIKF